MVAPALGQGSSSGGCLSPLGVGMVIVGGGWESRWCSISGEKLEDGYGAINGSGEGQEIGKEGAVVVF